MTTKKATKSKPRMIYVYALVDRQKFKENPDIVKHALYIGKGTGSRMTEHMIEVEKCLEDTKRIRENTNQDKIKSLMSLVKTGKEIHAVRLSCGFLSDKDALRAESLMITLINKFRKNTNIEPLLNAVNGHHAEYNLDFEKNSIYIYALIEKEKYFHNQDIVRDALYIGKGTSSRMSAHLNEVERCMKDKSKIADSSNPEKIQKIIEITKKGRVIIPIRISDDYLEDEDAFLAESMAISCINTSRESMGIPLLLNAVNGHHQKRIADMEEHFLYTQCEDVELPEVPEEYAILVKTTDQVINDVRWKKLKEPFISKDGKKIPKITIYSPISDKIDRRAWNPLDPWTPEEAHSRAYHYWYFKPERVIDWLNNSKDRPKYLFAGVPDGKDTVVRYVWEIDWNKNWERYDSGQWGIPVTDPSELIQHELLGKRLMLKKDGKLQQVLLGYAKGVRVIGIKRSNPKRM